WLRPGVTEAEAAAYLDYLLAVGGGEAGAISTVVNSSAHGWLPHTAPSHSVIGSDELIGVDACGVVQRYHSDLRRTFSFSNDARASDALARAAEVLHRVVDSIQPGDPVASVQATLDVGLRAAGLDRLLWWAGGY